MQRRFLAFLIAMGFFGFIFGCKQGGSAEPFRTEEAFKASRASQLGMTPKTVAQLRGLGVTDETQLKLEYFFYTNTKPKAVALAKKLADLGYLGSYDHSASDKKQFLVTGWTTLMTMDERSILDWTGRMCDLGRADDCEFDGWGTNPKQP